MKNVLLVIILIFIFTSAACDSTAGSGDSGKDLKFIAEFEGGKLYKAGEVSVLELKGNYRQMGRQYGQLLKSELNERDVPLDTRRQLCYSISI